MRPTHIYALVDPRTGFIRYVGKTIKSIQERLATHICLAKKTHTHSARWISGLLDAGLKPEAIHIETVIDEWQEAEQYWIAQFKFLGFSLTNHTFGGEGLNSYSHTKEARANMSKAILLRYKSKPNPLKGRKRPREVIEKMLATRAVRYPPKVVETKPPRNPKDVSAETRRKLSEANKGRPKPPRSPEHCAKIAEKARGRIHSAESNAKRATALAAYSKTPEGRANKSKAAKARWEKVRVAQSIENGDSA